MKIRISVAFLAVQCLVGLAERGDQDLLECKVQDDLLWFLVSPMVVAYRYIM